MRKTLILIATFLATFHVPASHASPEAAPEPKPALSQKDYSYGYWLNAFLKPKGDTSENVLCIETGHYGFMLNVTNISKPRFDLLQDDMGYLSALESGSIRLQDLAPAELNVSVEHDGNTYRMVDCWAGEGRRGELRQWESAQIAQHYDARGLRFRDEEGNTLGCSGTLDIVAWPESLTFNVEVAPAFVYTEGLSEGVVGSGHCVVGKPVDVPHSKEIDPEQLTLECWVKAPEALPNTGRWLLCKNSNESAEGCFGFGAGGWAPSAIMNIGGGRKNQHWIGMGGHHYKKNDWNHLALTYDGNEMKAYLNGHLQGTKTIGKPRTPGNGLLRIGCRADGHSQVAQGLYDQVRVWSRPLTAAEIKAHTAKPDTLPNREALVFEKNFDSGEVFTAPVWNNAKVRVGFKGGSQDWQHEELVEGTWKMGEKKQFTLNCNFITARGDARPPIEKPDAIHGGRASPRAVSVRLTTPDQQEFPVVFKPELNAYAAEIMKLKRPNRGKGPMTGYDEFDLVVDCGEEAAKPVPFYLHLQDPVSITGLIPILCHADGRPTGIPVQLSKNWHYGSYLRAYALLPVVPGPNVYKLRIAYCGYGTLPPVSHAQLSLVGYGGNQRWCQLALGCGGELITFNPDMSIGGSTSVCDVRLTMAKYGTNPNPWVWADAGWGGDWLGVFNGKNKLNFAEMKVAYPAHGPCLSDVAYHGAYGSGRSVLIDARVQLPRTDDYGRTIQNLEYRFQRELDTANTYFMKRHGRMYDGVVAYGNANGLIAEKRITGDLKKGDLLVPPTKLEGPGPWWVAFPERSRTGINREWPIGYVSMVIRDYEATFGTNTYSHPFLQVRIDDRQENEAKLETLFVPPPEVKTYRPGDRVKMDTVWLHLVTTTAEYAGFNEPFLKHLEENPKSWKTTYREAKGNNLKVEVDGGTLLNSYPIIIESTEPTVEVAIQGGVGFVPIRFEGLLSPDGYAVYEVVNGDETKLDQSVHGNDFWQTDYDAETSTYKMTFNLPVDGKENSRWVLKQTPGT